MKDSVGVLDTGKRVEVGRRMGHGGNPRLKESKKETIRS